MKVGDLIRPKVMATLKKWDMQLLQSTMVEMLFLSGLMMKQMFT